MKNNTSIIYCLLPIVLCILMTLSACKTTSNGTKSPRKNPQVTLDQAQNKAFKYKTLTLSGKGKAYAAQFGRNIGFRYRINMLNDSLIWFKASVMGVPMVKALISKDSVLVLNSMEKQYSVSDMSVVRSFTGLDVDFSMLEDLILGNLNLIPNRVDVVNKRANPQVFTGQEKGINFSYTIDTEDFNLQNIEAKSEMRNQHTQITYSEFDTPSKNNTLPLAVDVNVMHPEKAEMSLKHSKVSVNPSKINFELKIPESYERAK